MRYVDYITGTLADGDTVVFNINGEKFEAYVDTDYMSCSEKLKKLIFDEIIKQNKYEFATACYGYKTTSGDWPTSARNDFAALTRMVNAIYDALSPIAIKVCGAYMTKYELNFEIAKCDEQIKTYEKILIVLKNGRK